MKKIMRQTIALLVIVIMVATVAYAASSSGPSLTSNKKVYAYNESIYVTATGGTSTAWVGIYKKGDAYGDGAGTNLYWYNSNTNSGGYPSGTTVEIQKTKGGGGILDPGTYRIYLFKDSGYTVLKAIEVMVCSDDTSVKLTGMTYALDNQTDGFANGTVTITANSAAASGSDCVMYWADANGNPLEGYGALAMFKLTGATTTYRMREYTIIPPEAEKLIAYRCKDGVMTKGPVSVSLPSGCQYHLGSDYTMEFQMVSDTHVTSDTGAAGDVAHSNEHFVTMLADIQNYSPNSAGIFINGDATDNGLQSEYTKLETLYNAAKTSGGLPNLHLSLGNHDGRYGAEGVNRFRTYAKKFNSNLTSNLQNSYYEETVGGYPFLYLADEDCGQENWAVLSQTQLTWLDNRLEAYTQVDPDKPVFVLLHQPMYDTVAGSLPGQGWHNVSNEQQLRDVLVKYKQVILINSHTHWMLDSERIMHAGNSTTPTTVGTASVSYVCTSYENPLGVNTYGSNGYYVRVYDDKVVFMGRDFEGSQFLPSAMFVIEQDDITTSQDTYNLTVGGSVNLQAKAASGGQVCYTPEDTSVATVSSDGTVTATGEGTTRIYLDTLGNGTHIQKREYVTIQVYGQHQYSLWQETKSPSCETTGSEQRICAKCNEVQTRDIPALGHSIVSRDEEWATCMSNGWTGGEFCSRCDYVKSGREIIPAKGHTEGNAGNCTTDIRCWTCNAVMTEAPGHTEEVISGYAPTCTMPGLTDAARCTVCEAVLSTQEEIPALGHDDTGSDATCTTEKICARDGCDHVLEGKLGHDEVILPAERATCTETGLTEGKKCDRCKEVLIEQEVVDKLGHNEEILSGSDATCTETGLTEGKYCIRCKTTTVEQETIPALGHDESGADATCTKDKVCARENCDYVLQNRLGHKEVILPAVAATCTKDGLTEGKKCDTCGVTLEYQRPVNQTGHGTKETIPAVEASCTETGLTAGKRCSLCKEVTTPQEVTPKLGHNEVTIPAVAATCTETGLTEGKHCTRCGVDTVVQEVTPKLGHNEVTIPAVAASCTEAGLTEGKHCSRCDVDTVVQEVTPKLGHNEVTIPAVAATCTETGLTEGKHCTRCGEDTVAQTATKKLGHNEVSIPAKAATCTETGLTEGKHCTRCGEDTVAQTATKKLGHNEVTLPAVAATCTETGLTEGKHCNRCGIDTVEQEVTPKLGHNEVTLPAVAATCTESGLTEGKHCNRCGIDTVEQEVTPKFGHNEVNIPAVAATCTESGLTEGKHCNRCGEDTVAQTATKKLGHNEVILPAVAATCTETGLTEGKHCSRCGVDTVEQEVAPKLNHDEVTLPAVAATCTETGLTEGKHCSRCGVDTVAQEVTPKLSHNEVRLPAVAATCTETGLTEGAYCAICNAVLEKQSLVPKKEHQLKNLDAVAATCTRDGLTAGSVCTVCGEDVQSQKNISALGHKEKHLAAIPATCTESGLTAGKECTVCHEMTTAQKVIAPLGHKEIVIAGKETTCTAAGLTEGRYCYVCRTMTTVQTEIPAKGHSLQEIPAIAAACETAGMTAGSQCTVCNAVITTPEIIPATGHRTAVTETKRATLSEDGWKAETCLCGYEISRTAIAKIGKVKLQYQTATYNGKAKSPSLTVYNSKGEKLQKNTDYQVKTPTGRKNTGVYTYTVTFIGNYEGTETLRLTINPAKVTAQTPKAAKASLTAKWKRAGGAVTGYEVMTATNKKFTKGKKTTLVKGPLKTSVKIKKLQSKKTYYLRVRSYKTVRIDGRTVKLYSAWSTVKQVKVK